MSAPENYTDPTKIKQLQEQLTENQQQQQQTETEWETTAAKLEKFE